MNENNISMSEIKVQNLKDEIHNIITNNSGGSNSSGKRKREKDVKDNEISKDLPYTFLDEYDNYFNKNFPVDNCGINLDESYNDLKIDGLFLLGYK